MTNESMCSSCKKWIGGYYDYIHILVVPIWRKEKGEETVFIPLCQECRGKFNRNQIRIMSGEKLIEFAEVE